MPFILNSTQETQKVKALGSFFEFKPGQIKELREDICKFIADRRLEQGMVLLPQEYEDVEWRTTPEAKAAIEKARQHGIEHYIKFYRKIIYNNQVSLRMDLEKANIKADPAVFASDGEIEAMRIVAKYQKNKDDEAQKRAEEVRKLVAQTGNGAD